MCIRDRYFIEIHELQTELCMLEAGRLLILGHSVHVQQLYTETQTCTYVSVNVALLCYTLLHVERFIPAMWTSAVV